MRRTVLSGEGGFDFSGTRCAPERPGPEFTSSSFVSGEWLNSAGAESARCSSALTSTAEKSVAVQVLVGATYWSPGFAPRLAISWHCSWLEREEQLLAAQRGAHIGTASNASTVISAITVVECARTGIISFLLSLSRLPANFDHLEMLPRSPKSQRRRPSGNFDSRTGPAWAVTEDAAQAVERRSNSAQ